MSEKIIFHNPEHKRHKGWVDSEGKSWDVPQRLDPIIDILLSGSEGEADWIPVTEVHEESLNLIAKAHSIEMITAISEASARATLETPVTTPFDLDAEQGTSAIYPGTFEQALKSAECAILAADALVNRQTNLAITISRPPGHHAGRNFYHGFCYFNIAAIAAETMKESSKRVAIIDFDIHHGDGTQDIFYNDPDVLYVSLHADPTIVMPGTGLKEDRGTFGTIHNFPLTIGINSDEYMAELDEALLKVSEFRPDYLIIEAGFDGHRDEFTNLPPITQLVDKDYKAIGEKIRSLGLPSLAILGGGYNRDVTAKAFSNFLQGIGKKIDDSDSIELYTPRELMPD